MSSKENVFIKQKALNISDYSSFKNTITKNETKRRTLPGNFFEKVLDLELNIKRQFNITILHELVNHYSMAVDYFQNYDEIKYHDYEKRLNNLLSQPEILKKMNDFSKASNIYLLRCNSPSK